MKYLTIILILAGVVLIASSCCPLRTCGPVMVTQPVSAAVPVLPIYGQHRCHPGYVGYCAPYHLPYVTRTTVVNPVLPPYAPCNPCY